MYRTLLKQASGNNHSLIHVDLNSSVPVTWVARGVDVLRRLDCFEHGGRHIRLSVNSERNKKKLATNSSK